MISGVLGSLVCALLAAQCLNMSVGGRSSCLHSIRVKCWCVEAKVPFNGQMKPIFYVQLNGRRGYGCRMIACYYSSLVFRLMEVMQKASRHFVKAC